MKLYNVYRLCKQNIDFLGNLNASAKDELNSEGTRKVKVFTLNNWDLLKNSLMSISKIPFLFTSANECLQSVPDSVRDEKMPRITHEKYNSLINNIKDLQKKMRIIIELYESLNLENEGNGLDIKLPPCEDLSEYISYLKDINFIFTQCPFLQCENETLKFGSVDVGSNWLKLTVATAATTCFILTNFASFFDKAITLRSHYLTVQQQEEMLRSQQLKNELAEDQLETFNMLRAAGMSIVIKQLTNEFGELKDPEELDKAERSLEKLILLLDKGCEIYATLDAPEEVQLLFPEIQGTFELPDSVIKYLEDKGNALDE